MSSMAINLIYRQVQKSYIKASFNSSINFVNHQQQSRGIKNHVRHRIIDLKKRQEYEKIKYNRPENHRSNYSDWNYNAELFAFTSRLSLKIEDSLLRQSFVDKSYIAKEATKQEELGLDTNVLFEIKSNEDLGKEGFEILDKTLDEVLLNEYSKFPQEGRDAVKKYLNSDPVLSNISLNIGTKDLIMSSELVPTEEMLARTFRSLVASINKFSTNQTRPFIEDFVLTQLITKNINDIWTISTPWSMLTDILNASAETFEPRLLWKSGKNTLLAVFVVGLYDSNKKLIGTGAGETVEIAQEMSARDALKNIFGTNDPLPSFKFVAQRIADREAVKEKINLKASNSNY